MGASVVGGVPQNNKNNPRKLTRRICISCTILGEATLFHAAPQVRIHKYRQEHVPQPSANSHHLGPTANQARAEVRDGLEHGYPELRVGPSLGRPICTTGDYLECIYRNCLAPRRDSTLDRACHANVHFLTLEIQAEYRLHLLVSPTQMPRQPSTFLLASIHDM